MKLSGFKTYLDLKKQHYKCRHCPRTFTLETSLVESNCYLSTPLKQAIFLEASHKKSESDIARELNVSHSTINRIIHTSYEEQPLHFNSLPKVLCFDGFKSVKSAEGAMSFLFCAASNGKLIDMVEDRRLSTLKPYFMRLSKEAREGITHVVIDMYAPNMTLIKEVFPNAKIDLDKFHIVQPFSCALNKTRIRFMNQNKEFYNQFKHDWHPLLKAQDDINSTHCFYSKCYTNVVLEGVNNKIKIIKRIAFGYRSF